MASAVLRRGALLGLPLAAVGIGYVFQGILAPGPAAASPFVYPALTAALAQREVQADAVRRAMEVHRAKAELVRQRAERFEHRGRLAYQLEEELRALDVETKIAIEKILFGSPGAHRRYLERYGCAKWTDAALGTIAAHAPILEIGAGRGLWAHQLRGRGVEVVAFDDMSSVPLPECASPTPVLRGDQREVPRYPNHTLFLCYPPPGGMAHNCLQLYRGRTLLYIGEGRGGVNASPDFFDHLERRWDVRSVEDLDPYPGGCERLWVLDRRP